MKKGLLFVMSGPSGVGKGTLRKMLFENEELDLAFSISMATRNPRDKEVDGVDYFFVSKDKFLDAIDHDELLEWAEFCGNYYGTPRFYVEKLRNEGHNVLLEIEVQGALQVMAKEKDAITIFITPPSLEELESRIRGRKSESEEVIQERLAKAEKEMRMMGQYRYIVCNDDLNLANDLTTTIIKHYIDKNNNEQ